MPPLVALHPMGASAIVWSSVIGRLSEARRVYALDTIGDIGRSELDDPDRYAKSGRDFSSWLDDLYLELGLRQADVIAGSMAGWIALNHAIYAPHRIRTLAVLGSTELPPWRATLGVLGPMASLTLRPTEEKREQLITRCLGEGERVTREYRPWMRIIVGGIQPRIVQPFTISTGKLRRIKAPTLVMLGGKDGLIGSAEAAAKRARQNIRGCEVEILPDAGHVMSIDEPDFVAERIVGFVEAPDVPAREGAP